MLSSLNFQFLRRHDPILVDIAARAERQLDDPIGVLTKLRTLSEMLAQHASAHLGLPTYDVTHKNLIERLNDRNILTPDLAYLWHGIRIKGNEAVHEYKGDVSTARHQLKMAWTVALWFHRTFAEPHFKVTPWQWPPDPGVRQETLKAKAEKMKREADRKQREADLLLKASKAQQQRAEEAETARTLAEEALTAAEEARKAAEEDAETGMELAASMEDEVARLTVELEAMRARLKKQEAVKPNTAELAELAKRAEDAALRVDEELTEDDTRQIIDAKLREAGWETDTARLRYSKKVRPVKGRNMAIAEWPTASGPVDYVLFVGLQPIGVVEAKRFNRDVPDVLHQTMRYARDFQTTEDLILPGPWDDYVIPFAFATNGRNFFPQQPEQSGIWFRDCRSTGYLSRPLRGWYTPKGLQQLLRKDIPKANETLKREPIDMHWLRDYQQEAVREVEKAIRAGQTQILLTMATGTGKTRTCLGLIYRLLEYRRFNRILFVVDRTTLGEQAYDTFAATQISGNMSLINIHDVKSLDSLDPEDDTRLHVATIQGLLQRIYHRGDGKELTSLPIDLYDCIVVDECHRGYNLDKEMSDVEMLYRDEENYLSIYRRTLEHFDAVRIGLTATPALHTTQLFGDPVYTYSYQQAVFDGYLVDHEAPYRIHTKLSKDGITWEAGEPIQVFDKITKKMDLIHTPDQLKVDVAAFNKKVRTEPWNRVVCQRLVHHIDLKAKGKTLIFCVDNAHADLVVRVLKEEFKKRDPDVLTNDMIMKITGSVDRVSDHIRHFRLEADPRIVVTVDLLTTGVDVKPIDKLVFMRRIRSRILYEQMLGRATRTNEDLYGRGLDKTRFLIFDAVQLYKSLAPMSDMQPVVHNPKVDFKQLAREMANNEDETIRHDVQAQFLVKLRRKCSALAEDGRLTDMIDMTPQELVAKVANWTPTEFHEWLYEHPDVPELLDQRTQGKNYQLISDHEDEFLDETRGYGPGIERPEDYLEAFSAFVRDNKDTIDALRLIIERPRELTRKSLRKLVTELEKEGFTNLKLQEALLASSHEDMAVGIMGFIRQAALGDPLKPYAFRLREAFQKLKRERKWERQQIVWLDHIERKMRQDQVIDREALNAGIFESRGGYNRINKRFFDGELEKILDQVYDNIWSQSA